MRLVVQRVTQAAVHSGQELLGRIERGAVVLVGIAPADDPAVVDAMARKLVDLRYFEDAEGRTNLDIGAVGGAYLVVSQFTLLANMREGRRPGFGEAAAPAIAAPLVDRFVGRLRDAGHRVAVGSFGASMRLELVNEGPFTLVIDSERDLRTG